MKIKDGFLLREVAGETVVIASGDDAVNLNLMISLNSTGKFLWEQLQTETTPDALTEALLATYDVDRETASRHVSLFVEKLVEHDILE